MKKLMIRLPVYYLIAVSGMYFLQDYFIYHPERTDSKLIEKAAKNSSLRIWPDDIESYRGFVSPLEPSVQRLVRPRVSCSGLPHLSHLCSLTRAQRGPLRSAL